MLETLIFQCSIAIAHKFDNFTNISKRLWDLVYVWSVLLSLKFQANTYSFERAVTLFVGYYFSSGHRVYYVTTCMKLCANILGRNIHVRFKFSCVGSSHGLCARACAQLRGNINIIVDDLFSQVLAFRSSAAECIKSAQANNNNAMNFSTLLFSCRPYLISSFHDSVASPGHDVRGARCEFFSPHLPGILLS